MSFPLCKKTRPKVVVYGLVEEYYNAKGELSLTQKVSCKETLIQDQDLLRKEVIDLEEKTLYGYVWNKFYDLQYLRKLHLEFEKVTLIEDIAFNVNYFMDIDSMRDLFQTSSDYYNMVVSKKKLSIDSGKLYATTSKKAIEESSDVFINMMIPMMGMIVGLSVIIFAIVMYLMIKVMIDRSAQNIALMKVFGYRKKEIKKLYLDGNFYMIAIGALISVPLSKKLMDAMYPVMVSNIACGMNLSFTWQMYALIYAGIIITYLVINKLLVRKIYKVGLSDALKNRE